MGYEENATILFSYVANAITTADVQTLAETKDRQASWETIEPCNVFDEGPNDGQRQKATYKTTLAEALCTYPISEKITISVRNFADKAPNESLPQETFREN